MIDVLAFFRKAKTPTGSRMGAGSICFKSAAMIGLTDCCPHPGTESRVVPLTAEGFRRCLSRLGPEAWIGSHLAAAGLVATGQHAKPDRPIDDASLLLLWA